jgi:hypothetical protein
MATPRRGEASFARGKRAVWQSVTTIYLWTCLSKYLKELELLRWEFSSDREAVAMVQTDVCLQNTRNRLGKVPDRQTSV